MKHAMHAFVVLGDEILDYLPLAEARMRVGELGGVHTAYYFGTPYSTMGVRPSNRVWFKLNEHALTGDRFWLVVYDGVPSTVLFAEMLRDG